MSLHLFKSGAYHRVMAKPKTAEEVLKKALMLIHKRASVSVATELWEMAMTELPVPEREKLLRNEDWNAFVRYYGAQEK